MKLADWIKQTNANISECWGALPAEIRVFIYLLASAALSEITTTLTNTKTDNLLLAGLYNVLLVSLKNLPARIKSEEAR